MSGSVANAGIVPNSCRVAQAIAILATPLYCGWGSGPGGLGCTAGVGRKASGWRQPAQVYSATGLVTPVGYRTLSVAKYCLPASSGGDITLPTGNFQSQTAPSNCLFLEFDFAPTDAVNQTIREFAVFSGLTLVAAPVTGPNYFSPTDVASVGQMLMLQNAPALVRGSAPVKQAVQFVLQF